MPVIRAFRGLRYNTGTAGPIADLVAPPYDIIYDDWREQLYARNPYNIIRLIKTKDEPDDDVKNNKYSRAAAYIDTWMRESILRLDDEPSIYVRSDTYTVNGEEKTRYGFVALLRVEDFGTRVHPHERTLTAPKADRLKLVTSTKTNLSQIFSVFRDPDSIIQNMLLSAAADTPETDFVDEQGIHRKVWKVTDPTFISELCSLMEKRDIIIADGHHRYETALNYKKQMKPYRTTDDEPFDYVSMYFSNADAPGMTILPTHRKVSNVSTYSQNTFFSELKKTFDVEFYGFDSGLDDIFGRIAADSDRTNIYGIYTCDGYGMARNRKPSSPKELDVDVLHNIIIEKLLGISREAIRSGKHVHFCKSPEHAIDDVANHNDQVSFLMNAITTEELFRTVLKGVRMPQKSTYFYPKTMSGLVMYRIDRSSLG